MKTTTRTVLAAVVAGLGWLVIAGVPLAFAVCEILK